MPAGTTIPVEEYLHTAYQPDCEYVDGELLERNAGEYPHSKVQGLLYAYLLRRRKKWGITPILEQRVRLSQNKYLIPDICVVRGPEPTEKILDEPPLLWIEILSSQDRPIRVQRKVQEVLRFGVRYVWVVDPETIESYVYTSDAQSDLPDGVLRIPGTEIEVPLREIEED